MVGPFRTATRAFVDTSIVSITVPNNIRHKFGINHSLLNLYLENICNKKLLILFPIV